MEKTKQKNFVVILTPKYDSRNECKDIQEQIKRHVDGVTDITITCDTVCVYCNSIWEEEWNDGEKPMCCNKACEDWRKIENETNIKEIQG